MSPRGAKKWAAYGLTPLPDLTPPYVPLGGPHVALHLLSGTHDGGAVSLSARWQAVTYRVVAELSLVQIGDVVVVDDARSSGTSWQPPSRVLRVEAGADGLELALLRDASLAPFTEDEIEHLQPGLLKTFRKLGSAPTDDAFKRWVRALWSVDVWCPTCGAEGQLVITGLAGPELFSFRDAAGTVLPWPAGYASISGCDRTEGDPDYTCPRCATSWGSE